MTEVHIVNLERWISKLYTSLWEIGITQGSSGEDNILVDITEQRAVEISQIYNDFDNGVKDMMTLLNLVKENDCLAQKATVRNNVRLNGNFKIFSNLSLSTTLRYLRNDKQVKLRRLCKYINSIKEYIETQ